MTHDELLAKFNDIPAFDDKGHALRAVVELHNPFTPVFGGGFDYCFADDRPYPCPTIQAIEKELNA